MKFIKLPLFRMLLLLIISFALVSCGKKPEGRNFEVGGYIASFYASAYSVRPELKEDIYFNSPVSVEFSDLKSYKTENRKRVAGLCYMGQRRVIFDKEIWFSKGISDDARKLFVYHEFAHCALGRSHNQEYIILDGARVQASIMNGELLDIEVIKNNFSYYTRELFDPTISTQNNALNASPSIEEASSEVEMLTI